ncbi:MAG: M23 family metallopeptidase [Candidatus Limnocylindria bacterium]
MLNRVSGVVRATVHPRSTGPDRHSEGQARTTNSRHAHRRAIGLARFLAHVLTPTPRSRARAGAHALKRAPVIAAARPRTSARRRLYRRHVVLRLTSDRTLPIAIGLIVLLAAGVSLAPAAAPVGAAQDNTSTAARLVVGGGAAGAAMLEDEMTAVLNGEEPSTFVDDGTLYKPVAVDTSIQSSAEMLEHYTVKDGDTLTGIASRFGVSMMTLWWANKLTTKESIHVGQNLVIPPVTGLIVTVKTGDTLESVATANKVSVEDIVSVNSLEDTNLIVGQVLVLPGAKGEPMPTPTPKPTKKPSTYSGGGGGVAPTYSGGAWSWPVRGGGNYVSQYFHYGHYAIDIAASYGSPVVAAVAGTVVYAGWANTGCGYSVILQNSSSIYTMYCHNSTVTVARGQSVSRGQQIARVGSSGTATGSHLHFAVSIGYPHQSGSYFVNPLKYY